MRTNGWTRMYSRRAPHRRAMAAMLLIVLGSLTLVPVVGGLSSGHLAVMTTTGGSVLQLVVGATVILGGMSMVDTGSPHPARPPGTPPASPMAVAQPLRASDVDRQTTVDTLGRALAAGCLTLTEFDQRATDAWGATTRQQLAELTADLPSPLPSTG